MKNLTSVYRSSLQASTAATQAERNDAFRLRYQVYCLERGFEAPAFFDNQIETDDYDANAIHFLTRYRPTRSVLGVTRLVLDESDSLLPIESHEIPGVGEHLGKLRDAGNRIAEVSRLAVTRDLGSLCQTPSVNVPLPMMMGTPTEMPARIIPQHVSMGLLALLFKKSRESGITHWVALLDAALVRCYARLGIQGQMIGPAIEHRGKRQPVLMNLTEVWERIQERCAPLARLIMDFIAEGDRISVRHDRRHMRGSRAPLHMLPIADTGLRAQL